MARRYPPELSERMRKRRYWFYIDDERLSSAGAANAYVGEKIFHAAWRANLILKSGGEGMKVGDRTPSVRRGNYTVFIERREDVQDKSSENSVIDRRMLFEAGWSKHDVNNLSCEELKIEAKAELERQSLGTPHFNQREDKYALVKIRVAQGIFRNKVMTNWHNRCAITGTTMALEAAHIVSYAQKGSPTVENGLCLAADIHTLLDRGHLVIKSNRVRLSDEAKADTRYVSLEGKKLRTPREPVAFPVV
ncbi:HNH endonuclease [Yersinia kristensenii]|uniref:HNH endonuclease n=1 Tax=Yersinia kristensenii TaxID=28152 RepID=UPI0011AAA0B8|nr:HNH endonuclease signature motif containing protein [Yersinia kristensenii]